MSVPDHLLDPPDWSDPPECPEGHGFMEYNADGADSYWYCWKPSCDQELDICEPDHDDRGEGE